MAFLSSAHTHSTWCDGKNPIQDMLRAACELGFVSLGFSGHAAQGYDFDYSMSLENQRGYFNELHTLQKTELPLRLWAGLEVDALAGKEELNLSREADYRIGSAHYLHILPDRRAVAVDGDPDLLKSHIDQAFHGDGLAAASHYFDLLSDFILREKPDIIGHFDLIRKYAKPLALFDETDPAYRKLALAALEKCAFSGSMLEVNTGGMARGYLPTPYPTLELLQAWREMGGRVTITSDCHDRCCLNHAFDIAENLIKEAGFRSVMQLGTGDALWEEIALP